VVYLKAPYDEGAPRSGGGEKNLFFLLSLRPFGPPPSSEGGFGAQHDKLKFENLFSFGRIDTISVGTGKTIRIAFYPPL
jgi:hypothetical protein